MSYQAEALEWWDSLKPNEQQAMVFKHFPRMEFMIVSMTDSNIEQIFKHEQENENSSK